MALQFSHHNHCRSRHLDLSRSPGSDTPPPLRPRSHVVRAGDTATASLLFSGLYTASGLPSPLPEPACISLRGLTRRCWTAVSGRPWTCWFPPYKAPAASHKRGGCKDSTGRGCDDQVTLTGSGAAQPVPIRQQQKPGPVGAAAQPLGTSQSRDPSHWLLPSHACKGSGVPPAASSSQASGSFHMTFQTQHPDHK